MSFEKFINAITPAMYLSMKEAVAIGRWPDGRALTTAEKEATLRAVIAYDHKHQVDEERIGHINGQCKAKSSVETTDQLKWE